jgi:hypothetical protein
MHSGLDVTIDQDGAVELVVSLAAIPRAPAFIGVELSDAEIMSLMLELGGVLTKKRRGEYERSLPREDSNLQLTD